MAAFSVTTNSNSEMGYFSRFLAIGAVGTALDFSLLILFKLAGMPTLFANSISFIAGLLNTLTWYQLWTFGDSTQPNWRKQLIKFTVVSLFVLTVNNLIVLSLETFLGDLMNQPQWGYLPAKVIATIIAILWNYFANRIRLFTK